MVLPDLFAQRGPFPRNAGTSTPGLGVLNALTQQIKQSSLHAPKGDQWKEFHQLLKGALQQARQDVRETRRDDRHQARREAHEERVENRLANRAEARVDARLDAHVERRQAWREAHHVETQGNNNLPKPVCTKPTTDPSELTDANTMMSNEQDTLDQLINDLRKLGLTLPGEQTEATPPATDDIAADADTHETSKLDDPSLLDALPSITEQLQTLLPQLPPHEQTLLTQALSGLEHFSSLVSASAKPLVNDATSAPQSVGQTPVLPTDNNPVANLQASLKNVVSALPEEAKEALKQVFQLLNDAKQARHPQASDLLQAANNSPELTKPALDSKFVHPLQALLRHLGEANETKIAQATPGQFGATTDNPSSQSDTATPTLADMTTLSSIDTDPSSAGMVVPFSDVAISADSAFDPSNVALSTTISMTSRAGMTNPILQNRPQPTNHPIQSQVVEAAQIGIKDGKNELVVQLNPQHLGKVTVTLTSDANKQVTAVLVTESHHVQAELEKDIKGFIRSMEHHGISLVKVSVIQANTEAQTSHNAAQDQDASQQQQSMNQQGSNHSSGSHSQREAFEWRQQFMNNSTFSTGDLVNNDAGESTHTGVSADVAITNSSTETHHDGGVDLRA